jgi:hypothetical protein
MGLYDSYRQANSQAISQFTGSIVPEVSQIGREAKQNYEQALDTDDKLTEAMGNLQHLKTSEDTAYANELKAKYASRLQERSGRADYENLGRRTRRDAMQFSQDYMPLVQRQRDMAAIVKNVQDDKDIFDPNEKARIIRWQQSQNSVKKDASGNYERDAQGRIALGSIQALPYAKDVDQIKELDDYLKTVEAKVTQGGYHADNGLLISNVDTIRDPKVMAVLASQFMKLNPQIKAMNDRKVMLSTYDMSPAQFKTYGDANNKSLYQQMKDNNMSDVQIAAQAKLQGKSVTDLKVSELDRFKQAAKTNGMGDSAAYAAYYKSKLYDDITAPTVAMVAEKLKIDKHTIEARSDPDYDAKAQAKASADMDKAANIVYTDTNFDDIEPNKSNHTPQEIQGLRDNVNTVQAQINAAIAQAQGIQPLKSGFTKEQRDSFAAIGKSKQTAIHVIKTLQARGQTDAAAALQKNIENREMLNGNLAMAQDQMSRKFAAGDKARGVGYTLLTDVSSNGRVGSYVTQLTSEAQSGALNGIDLQTGQRFGKVLQDGYGDQSARLKKKGDGSWKDLSVSMTTSSAEGKPIAIVTMPDGKHRTVALEGVNPAILSEAYVAAIKGTGARNTSDLRSYEQKANVMALGEQSLQGVSRAELAMWEPGTATHPIGGGYSVRVGKANGVKTYRLMAGDNPKASKVYTDPNNIYMDLGWIKYKDNVQ